MAKKKDENAPDSGPVGPETGTQTTTVDAPAPDGPVLAARLSIQLDEHGSIAWDRMRPETQAKLRTVIAGSVPAAAAAPVLATPSGGFPPDVCGVLYDSLSMLLVGLAKRSGYPDAQASAVGFTPDERATLIPPTVAVLNKYNTSLGKYQEEIVLGVVLTTVLTGKLAILRAQPAAPPPLTRPGEALSFTKRESQEENRPV